MANGRPNMNNFSITGNTITMHDPINRAGIGLFVTCMGAASFASGSQISNNIINLGDANTGISCSNVVSNNNRRGNHGLWLVGNTVNCNQPNIDQRGILLEGGEHTRLEDNTITGAGLAMGIGIFVNGSKSNAVICNNTNNLREGITFSGDCTISNADGSEIGRNRFGTHATGLWHTISSITGQQELNGNTWLNNSACYTIQAAKNDNTTRVNNGFDGYTVNPNQSTGNTNTTFMPPPPATQSWFLPVPGNNKQCIELLAPGDGGGGNDFEHAVAADDLDLIVYEEGLKWTAERALYTKISQDSTMLQDSLLAAFAAAKAQESVGMYSQIEEMAKTALTPTALIQQQLTSYDLQINGLMVGIKYLDSLLLDTTLTATDRSMHETQRYGKIVQLKLWQTTADQTYTVLATENEAELNALLAVNRNVATSKVFETNEKMANQIYYNSLPKGYDLDEVDRPVLLAIAAQCPYSGGDGVFKARAICALFDSTNYDDRAICAEQGVLWRSLKPKSEIKQELLVKVYPNPAQNSTNLLLQGEHEALQVTVIDMLGQIVTTLSISADTYRLQLPFEQASAGLYSLILRNNTGDILHQQKIAIIK
jgi:hypothetical protein